MLGQPGRDPVERADLQAPLQQLGDQVGTDETRTAGDQNPAQISLQRRISHAGQPN